VNTGKMMTLYSKEVVNQNFSEPSLVSRKSMHHTVSFEDTFFMAKDQEDGWAELEDFKMRPSV